LNPDRPPKGVASNEKSTVKKGKTEANTRDMRGNVQNEDFVAPGTNTQVEGGKNAFWGDARGIKKGEQPVRKKKQYVRRKIAAKEKKARGDAGARYTQGGGYVGRPRNPVQRNQWEHKKKGERTRGGPKQDTEI